MKTMKRFLSFAMVCLLLCGLLPSFALADDSMTCGLVLKDCSGMPGETVTVELEITSNPGIGAMKLNTLDYDHNVLELTDVTVNLGSDWNALVAKENDKFTGNIVLDRADDVTITGVIAAYTFKILDTAAAGETQVNLLNCEVASYDKEVMVPFTLTPAKITIGEGSEIDKNLKFASRNITLQDNIQVNFKASKSVIDGGNYENPYVIFNMNGVETTAVGTLDSANTYYVFSFRNIAPNKMNDTFSATIYATVDGNLVEGVTLNYSVCQYCYSQLNKQSSNNELAVLLVDLLNYGAQSQIYTNYNTNNLANDALTETQASWATAAEPSYSTVQDTKYETVENPLVSWKALGLYLLDTVSIRLRLAVEDKTGLVIKVRDDNGREWSYNDSALKPTDSEYFFYFSGLKADQMRETVYITVYKNGEAVSNTVRYSIESYCYRQQTTGSDGLKQLLSAMMKYGDSAYNYAH